MRTSLIMNCRSFLSCSPICWFFELFIFSHWLLLFCNKKTKKEAISDRPHMSPFEKSDLRSPHVIATRYIMITCYCTRCCNTLSCYYSNRCTLNSLAVSYSRKHLELINRSSQRSSCRSSALRQSLMLANTTVRSATDVGRC